MIHNLNNFVNESSGSSLNFSAHGGWGKEKNPSAEKSVRPKVLGAKPKQAGKKEGGGGKGFFARSCLPFPFRLSKRKAGGGFGGNSAFLLPNQNEASPATLQFIARHHRKILFSLGEKIRRAQNEKSKEYFSESTNWRRGRDLNSRGDCSPTGFRDLRLKPLSHPSLSPRD